MQAIAQRDCSDTTKESALKTDCGRKPLVASGSWTCVRGQPVLRVGLLSELALCQSLSQIWTCVRVGPVSGLDLCQNLCQSWTCVRTCVRAGPVSALTWTPAVMLHSTVHNYQSTWHTSPKSDMLIHYWSCATLFCLTVTSDPWYLDKKNHCPCHW